MAWKNEYDKHIERTKNNESIKSIKSGAFLFFIGLVAFLIVLGHTPRQTLLFYAFSTFSFFKEIYMEIPFFRITVIALIAYLILQISILKDDIKSQKYNIYETLKGINDLEEKLYDHTDKIIDQIAELPAPPRRRGTFSRD